MRVGGNNWTFRLFHWRIQGGTIPPTPLFWHTNFTKHSCDGSWCPREILDRPLCNSLYYIIHRLLGLEIFYYSALHDSKLRFFIGCIADWRTRNSQDCYDQGVYGTLRSRQTLKQEFQLFICYHTDDVSGKISHLFCDYLPEWIEMQIKVKHP